MCGDGGVSVGSGHCINKTLWSDKGEGEGEVGRFRRGKKRDPHSCLSARCTGIFACAFFFFFFFDTILLFHTRLALLWQREPSCGGTDPALFSIFFSQRTHTHTHTHIRAKLAGLQGSQ